MGWSAGLPEHLSWGEYGLVSWPVLLPVDPDDVVIEPFPASMVSQLNEFLQFDSFRQFIKPFLK